MNCNDENMISKLNCGCESCTPVLDYIINDNQSKLTPVLLDRLYNCTCHLNYDYNQQSVFVFNVTGSNYTYPNNGKVTINKISISYDNIGLPLSNTNSVEVYYNGKLKEFAPINLATVYFDGVPFYLFNELTNTNDTQPICCCNNEKSNGIVVRLSQRNQIFVTSNLKITVTGCIDNLPFSAMSEFDILSTTQTLGFSLFNINSKLCWPSSLDKGSIFIRYTPTLCADSICPTSNYTSDVTLGTNGYFYAITNLLFINNISIDILNKESIPLITNDCDNCNNCDNSTNNIN